jgi:hypothetical protein
MPRDDIVVTPDGRIRSAADPFITPDGNIRGAA